MAKTRKWIMVADSDEDFRKKVVDMLLSHFGKEVKIVEADDGMDAITKLKNQTFHLIITEWDMPRKNGAEIIESVRSSPFNYASPLVVVSSEEHPEIEKDFEFVNFAKKPIDPFEFAQMIRNLFSIGSTEKMISASIFSSLLDSSIGFLQEALKIKDFNVGEMAVKKAGQELTGDYAAIITVYVGKVSNTFSVLCSKETLEKLRDGSDRIKGSELSVICRSLGYVILKHVLSDCGIIDSNEVHTKDISQDPTILTSKKGIVLPITNKGVDYTIFATTQGGDL